METEDGNPNGPNGSEQTLLGQNGPPPLRGSTLGSGSVVPRTLEGPPLGLLGVRLRCRDTFIV